MKQRSTQLFEVELETHAETGRVGAACNAIGRAGGIVHVGDAILKKIVYSAPRSLEPEINAAIGGKPGERVS